MHIQDLAGKKICILGYGREGKAMAEALEKYAKGCEITIADKNTKLEIRNSKFEQQLGQDYLKNLERFDCVIKSPGIPPDELLTTHYKLLTSPTHIFLDTIKGSGALVIGVTGSKGKSTTSSLIYEILKAAGKNVFLVGNIGEPAVSHIADATKGTVFVMEMSSYQLMDLTVSPEIAVITTFFPEHLDYHSTRPLEADSLMASHARYTPLENYLEAKKHITRFQTNDDVVFFNTSSKESAVIAEEGNGTKMPVSAKDSPVMLEEIKLQGAHNLGNIALAYAVAMHLGADSGKAIETIKNFKGLPHRLESLGIHKGIEWINDSISTTPESAIAALDALGDRVQTIILGGQDRGYDFSKLTKRVKKSSIKTVILLPDSGATIKKALKSAKTEVKCMEATSMQEAVNLAKQETKNQKLKTLPIVLLSPASPSYGHFKNFEDRGEQFARAL